MTDVVEPTEDADPSSEPRESADDAVVGPARSRVGLVVSLVVALLAVAFVGVLATREPATERRSKSPLIGQVAPAITARTLDGREFDIDDHRGQWVVVNFFATWCKPCVQEHPELVAFDEAHRPTGDATVVSVVYDEPDLDVVRDFFAERGGEWPVVTDDGLAAAAYGVVAVPETYLVTPLGYVVQKYTGGVTRAAIEQDIATLEAAVADQAGEGGS
jgi:cytochrome c biogenesis protein CcmG, thiol:disulfide interchange protein DsbE